jgi:anti-anti-sigma regulatory factor
MSTETTIQAHIAFELIDDHKPDVVVVEFLSREIASPRDAHELAEQLDVLLRSDLPRFFVIDFSNVRAFGSTAFGEVVRFARKVIRLYVCNLPASLRLGAAMIGLEGYAEICPDRQSAIQEARRAAMWDQEDTVDYPVSWIEFDEPADRISWSS